MAEMHMAGPETGAGASRNLASAANWLGAGISLALIIGIGVWSYKLVMRDVSGIPVVRAAEGPMRVAPEDPGGQIARHEGLSVNHVAGTGATTPPPDELVLAPRPLDVTDEDQPLPLIAQNQTNQLESETIAPASLVTNEDQPKVSVADANDPLQALANQIAANAAPLTPIDPAPEAGAIENQTLQTTVAAPVVETPEIKIIPASVPGVRRSLRPAPRPEGLQTVRLAAPEPQVSGAPEIDPATLPKGTRLVQFGAYDSAEIARNEWTRLEARFGDYLEGKSRVIEKATSGGRVFFRLRAHGFADLSDSRRFCAAFVSDNADCIPVVSR